LGVALGDQGVRIPKILLVVQLGEVLERALGVILNLGDRWAAQFGKLGEYVLV
jgi:hypothetical protein